MSAILSIVIPAYNEERFIGTLLEQIRAVDLAPLGIVKEIIVVDDCSARSDGGDRRRQFPDVRLHRQAVNGGKGSAVRAGHRDGDRRLLIIQDADLEYDPNDYVPMLAGAARRTGRRRLWQPLSGPRPARRTSRWPPISGAAA